MSSGYLKCDDLTLLPAARCADCDKMPDTCQWGGGPYAGTLLLYLQEVAVNKILTQAEWDSLPLGLLDHEVSDQNKGRAIQFAFALFSHLSTQVSFSALKSTRKGTHSESSFCRSKLNDLRVFASQLCSTAITTMICLVSSLSSQENIATWTWQTWT